MTVAILNADTPCPLPPARPAVPCIAGTGKVRPLAAAPANHQTTGPTRLALILLLATWCSNGVHAQQAPTYDRVGLSESAEVEIDNDRIVAIMSAQAEDRAAARAADRVNQLMQDALETVKRTEGVKAQTLGYNSQPLYEKAHLRGWRVSQTLRLESPDTALIGTLIAQLQQSLKLTSIDYQVSDQQRRSSIAQLTRLALQRFRERAQQITEAMGHTDYRVVRIDLHDSDHRPAPMPRGMLMMDAAMATTEVATPRFEAGTRQITLTINGEIELGNTRAD